MIQRFDNEHLRMIQNDVGIGAQRTNWMSRITQSPWAEISVLLIAACTRFWRLGYHSIWFDESISLKWARTDPAYIWQVTFPLLEDKHPPFYYLMLHYWYQFLGGIGLASSDTALRALGSFLGVLTVAGILLVASKLATRTTGLIAGMLLAVAPILVWYSQELRMFQPATTAIVWSACAMVYTWLYTNERRRYLWWLIFILTMVVALYSYLFSAFMLPAAGLTVLILAYHRRSYRYFAEGAIALFLVTLVFLPLANNAWFVNASESTPGVAFENFALHTFRMIKVFTVWRIPWPPALSTATVIVYGLLALVGIILPYSRSRQSEKVGPLNLDQTWIIIWLLTPFLIANLMLSRSSSIFDEDRYLLILVPFFLWAVARGISSLASYNRLIGLTTSVVAIAPLLLALPYLWTPAMARENWRAAADYIAEYHSESTAIPDAVIAHVDYTHEPLEWYVRQKASFEELPIFFPYGGTLQPEQMDDIIAPPLIGLVGYGTHTAWLTQSHLEGVDDQRLVEQWFAENYPVVTEQYPAGIKLSAYALQYRYPELPQLGTRAVYPETELASGLVLAACEVIQDAVSAQDETMHPPSGWVHTRLWWRAEEPVEIDFTTSVQVIGTEGVWGDRLTREGGLMDKWPTSNWEPGELVREDVDINLNPLTPPGNYPVLVNLVSPNGTSTSQAVECGTVEVH